MLHRVGDVYLAAFDSRVGQSFIQQLPRWPDKRQSRLILLLAGHLTYNHQVTSSGTSAKHHLRSPFE
jgi:uncharacterized protein YceH (UPF0502 family)